MGDREKGDTASHPIDEGMSVIICSLDKLVIRLLCGGKSLDHLDAIDVFHRSIVERLSRIDRPFEIDVISSHHPEETEHADDERKKADQSNPPVDHQKVDEADERSDEVS